jgi:Glycosyl transferase family 2
VSQDKPFFSIVIPTTRPHYLKYSLASVLAQTFGDFEVIIAFNRKPGGAELGELPDDPRIRVTTAETFAPMHENWERGFKEIRGQWALLLGDDDCLIRHALEIVARKIEENPDTDMMLWRWGGFVVPEWPLPDRGRISIPGFAGKIETRASESVEELLYGFDPDRNGEMKAWLPSVMRGAVRSDVVRTAQQRTGSLCHPLVPDFAAAAQIVVLTKKICLLDLPLVIINHPVDSMAAASAGLGDVLASQFYDPVGNPRFTYTLVQTRHGTHRPVIAETLMSMRAKYKPDLAREFNPSRFLAWHMTGLLESRARGTDTTAAEAEAHAALETLGAEDRSLIKECVSAYEKRTIASANPQWRRRIVTTIQALLLRVPFFLPVAASLTRRYGITGFGPNMGVDEISKFAELVDKLIGRLQGARGAV